MESRNMIHNNGKGFPCSSDCLSVMKSRYMIHNTSKVNLSSFDRHADMETLYMIRNTSKGMTFRLTAVPVWNRVI